MFFTCIIFRLEHEVFIYCIIVYFCVLFNSSLSDNFEKLEKQKQNLFEKLHFTSSTNLDSFPFQNKSLPIKDRVDDLVCIRCVLNKHK